MSFKNNLYLSVPLCTGNNFYLLCKTKNNIIKQHNNIYVSFIHLIKNIPLCSRYIGTVYYIYIYIILLKHIYFIE